MPAERRCGASPAEVVDAEQFQRAIRRGFAPTSRFLLMYHNEYSITPSQQATNGALSIFVAGCQQNDVRMQLFGLSILSSATEAQVLAAMPFAQTSQRVTSAEIHAMLAR